MSAAFWFMIATLGTAGICFVGVVVWLAQRTKEREAHYRNELVRRFTESGDSAGALQYLRDVDRAEEEKQRNSALMGGLVNMAVGAALMVFLYALVPDVGVYLVGLIPLLVGLVLVIAASKIMKPKA